MQDETIPVGLCQCGCGERTLIATMTRTARGYVKGQPRPYVGKHATRLGWRILVQDCGYPTPCHIWQGCRNADGYGTVAVGRRSRGAHLVAWEKVNGAVPEGLQLDHLCHDPETCTGGSTCIHRACCNPAHLEPVTNAENQRRGKNAKLTEEQAAEIRASSLPHRTIAALYGVAPSTVGAIKQGKAWKQCT